MSSHVSCLLRTLNISSKEGSPDQAPSSPSVTEKENTMKDGVILIHIYPNISLEGKSLSQCPGVTVIAMIEGL